MYRHIPFRADERGLLGPTGPIGPAFSHTLMRMLVAAIRPDSELDEPSETDLTTWDAALTAMEAFQPRTAIEAMLAAQAIAAHHAIMECHARCLLPETAETTAIRLRSNAVSLTHAMDTTLRMLERRQARPVPPPLPEVPAAVDAVLDLELERAKRRAAAAAARAEAAEADAPDEPMRPAIVIPPLEPVPDEERARRRAEVEAYTQALNDQWDRERGGTPQEWYARQREEARLIEEAQERARAERGEAKPGSAD